MQAGETVEHEGAKFTVESVDRRRIRRVRYTAAVKEERQPTAAAYSSTAGPNR